MANNPLIPYNDLPLIPPKIELETKPVLKKCISANRALAELKGAGDLIPNQSMLINAIPLQEAKLSSEIENIVTTQDDMYMAEIGVNGNVDPHTKEVLRYRTALKHGYEVLKENKLSIDLMVELCGIVREESIEVRDQEPIIIQNRRTKQVIYTPPRGNDIIRAKLENLESFLLEQNDMDPLIKMALLHYQFEAIHPFTDGNGRTGRILNILYLLQEGLLTIPVLYLSRFIIQNKAEYYVRIKEVTEKGDWENWLLYNLSAIEDTAKWTTSRIIAIRDLFDKTCDRCREELPKRVYSKELIELIFIQPYCKVKFVVDAGIAKRQSASEYLKELEKIGILTSEKHGREIIYKHPALMEVLHA